MGEDSQGSEKQLRLKLNTIRNLLSFLEKQRIAGVADVLAGG